MRFIPVAVALAASVTVSGCIWSTHDAPVNYVYEQKAKLPPMSNPSQVVIGEVIDERGMVNPRMIIHHTNAYGAKGSGGYQAEKNISEILQDALTSAMIDAGLSEESDRKITLQGELIDLESEIFMGWTKGQRSAEITMKLSAVNDRSDQIIWRDTFMGDGKSEKYASDKVSIAEAFARAIDDLIENILEDDFFQQKVVANESL